MTIGPLDAEGTGVLLAGAVSDGLERKPEVGAGVTWVGRLTVGFATTCVGGRVGGAIQPLAASRVARTSPRPRCTNGSLRGGSADHRHEGLGSSLRPRRAEGLVRIGFEIVAQVIWDKGLFAMGTSWYHWSHEPCWVARKAGAKVPFRGSRDQSTIWRVPSPKMIMGGSTEPRLDHPTQKPLVLFETPIRNHLKAGDPFYEPFCGSGTALIAAERTGARCYALEIDSIYVEVALARWERFSGEIAVRVESA